MSRDPTKREEMVERIFRSTIAVNKLSANDYPWAIAVAEETVARILREGDVLAERLSAGGAAGASRLKPPADPVKRGDTSATEALQKLIGWLLTSPLGAIPHEYRLMGQDGPLYTWDVPYMAMSGVETCAITAIEHYVEDRENRDGPGPRPYYYVGAYTYDSDEPARVHKVDG
jgi:hypothetical protein